MDLVNCRWHLGFQVNTHHTSELLHPITYNFSTHSTQCSLPGGQVNQRRTQANKQKSHRSCRTRDKHLLNEITSCYRINSRINYHRGRQHDAHGESCRVLARMQTKAKLTCHSKRRLKPALSLSIRDFPPRPFHEQRFPKILVAGHQELLGAPVKVSLRWLQSVSWEAEWEGCGPPCSVGCEPPGSRHHQFAALCCSVWVKVRVECV